MSPQPMILALIFANLCAFGTARAETQTAFYGVTQQEKTFAPDPGGACGLKRFVLQTFKTGTTNLNHPGKTRSTTISATLETTDPSCITQYGMVQFIRGCAYNVYYNPVTKKYDRGFQEIIQSRGLEGVPFVHRKWSVDSLDVDPLYQSSDNASTPEERTAWLYRTNGKLDLQLSNDKSSLESDYRIANDPQYRNFLLRTDRSNLSQVFVTDGPTTGNYDPRYLYDPMGKTQVNVTNTSLEFKMCLYEMKNIPVTGDPKGFDVPASEGGPIVCFDWDHKYTFNFKTKDFETDKFKGIDPFCATAPLDANSRDRNGKFIPQEN